MTANQLVKRFSIALFRQVNKLLVRRNGIAKIIHVCGNKQVTGHDRVIKQAFCFKQSLWTNP